MWNAFIDAHPTMGMTLILLVGLALILAVIFVPRLIINHIQRKKRTVARENIAHEYKLWKARTNAANSLSPVSVPIQLHQGESAYHRVPWTTLYETRSVRKTSYGGASVRVAKGFTIHTGGATSEGHEEWRPVACGDLVITNQRIVFSGDKLSRVIPLAKILSYDSDEFAVAINSETYKKSMRFAVPNGLITRDIISILLDNL